MYNKILVSHAGTKAGNKALDHAKKLAKIHNSEITILHVFERIQKPVMTFDYERARWHKDLENAQSEMKKELHSQFTKIADDLKKDGINVSVKVVEGYPDDEIAKIANEDDYDCLVMAKRRKLPGIKAILKLGSVSRKVLEKVSCPIILIDGE